MKKRIKTIRLFGFEFNRITPDYIKQDKVANDAISFVDRDSDSTAAVIYSTPFASGSFVDMNGNIKTEAEFITKYREISGQPEVDAAIAEIVNQAITTDEEYVVKIDLDNVPLEENSKLIIKEQFDEVLTLFDFNVSAYDIFKRWYIDGRIYYHAVIDPKAPQEGIKELRYVDPRKLREIKEVQNQKLPVGISNQAAEVQITKNEFYLYNEKGFTSITKAPYGMNGDLSGGIRISKDSVIHVPSGLTDENGAIGLSYLHKAIKPTNELRTLEDSLIIYRLSRSSERRVWNVDVGTLPPLKAQQYLQSVMNLQKNRLIYDATTGQVRDDRKMMTMTEDFWIPKWADGRGTTVDVLQGGQNLGQMDDVVYFQKKLYNALNVPVDRLLSDSPFSDNTQEISRAEVKFNKFIVRLRQQFTLLFTKALERHIVLKGLMSIEEFKLIEKLIKYHFARDTHWDELVDQQVLTARLNTFMLLEQSQIIGKYFSHKWVRKNIFQQTDEDIVQMTQEIMEEMQDPLYNPPEPEGGSEDDGSEDDSSQANNKGDPEDKVDGAKHIVQALTNVKKKSPKDEKDLRKAAQVISKHT